MPDPITSPHIYDLIIIGRGSAAAMYLNTVQKKLVRNPKTSDMFYNILVIGKDDPWAGARGYEPGQYTENINQAEQLFAHPSGDSASRSQNPVNRQTWADQNRTIIDGQSYLNGEVTSVENSHQGSGVYLVKTSTKGNYLAAKIVIATGAGIETSDREYHNVPEEVKKFRKTGYTQIARVLDLDQFQKGDNNSGIGKGRSVAIMGANAGTDAVMQAATRGYSRDKVYWLLKNTQTPGTALTWNFTAPDPTFTAANAGKERVENGCVWRYETMSISTGGAAALRITTNTGTFDVDYLVYAVGQRGGGVKRAKITSTGPELVPFVDKSLTDNLAPIYDLDQRFAEMDGSGSGGAWQHVIGLQLKGSNQSHGIQIVGSAANQAARGIDHTYLDADYNALLKVIPKSFLEIARKNSFMELFTQTVFSTLYANLNLEAKDNAFYEQKKSKYLLALEITLRLYANALLGSKADSEAARETRLKVDMAMAQDLCYMFMLRVKAARYLEGKRVSDMLSEGLKRTVPVQISDNRLLGGIQRNVAATNSHYNKAHIQNADGINFMEDQQTLALHIALTYPNMPESAANGVVQRIITERKSKARGFDENDLKRWKLELERKNVDPKGYRNVIHPDNSKADWGR